MDKDEKEAIDLAIEAYHDHIHTPERECTASDCPDAIAAACHAYFNHILRF